MKKIIIIILVLYSQKLFSQVISLEDAFNYEINNQPYPPGTSYVKDINNRLDSFVGTWKGSHNGRLYELRFTKKENWNFGITGPGVNWDVLIGRILVLDSISGGTIYNTLSTIDNLTYFTGDNFCGTKVYCMNFYGLENGCYDYGDVSITLADNDVTLMGMFYHRGGDLIDPRTCLGGYENYRTILPAKLHLRKQ